MIAPLPHPANNNDAPPAGRQQRLVPIAPRLLDLVDAAAYCGVSPATFEAYIQVPAVRLGNAKRYDIRAIDRAIDALQGIGRGPGGRSLAEKLRGADHQAEGRPPGQGQG